MGSFYAKQLSGVKSFLYVLSQRCGYTLQKYLELSIVYNYMLESVMSDRTSIPGLSGIKTPVTFRCPLFGMNSIDSSLATS